MQNIKRKNSNNGLYTQNIEHFFDHIREFMNGFDITESQPFKNDENHEK